MAAKKTMPTRHTHRRRVRGQSMVEFAFLVPIIVGMLFVLIQVETAISGAIVSQKYARQHLHFLFFSNRYYPERFLVTLDRTGDWAGKFWVGVDDNIDFNVAEPVPKAPRVGVGREKN